MNDIETGSRVFKEGFWLLVDCLCGSNSFAQELMQSFKNDSTSGDQTKQHAIVLWILWFSFLQSAFIFTWFIGGGIPEGENAAEPMAFWLWLLTFGGLAMATVIRWIVIPKVSKPQQQLATLIVGLSLCEMPVFVSLFFMQDYPQNQIAVLIVAVLCVIQFAPSYATPGYRLEN